MIAPGSPLGSKRYTSPWRMWPWVRYRMAALWQNLRLAGLLLDRSRLTCRSCLTTLRSRPARFVGRVLACGDLVKGAPLRFHPDVGVAREHGARDVPEDAHDHFVVRAGFACIGQARSE